MKKLITLIFVLTAFLVNAQSPGYGSVKAAEFQQRILDSSGTYLPNCYPNAIDNLYRQGIYPSNMLMAGGYYDGNLGSQLPVDGTGDFTWTRGSTGTTVGSDGYVHPLIANQPRIDYSNGCPVIASEPAAINLLTQEFEHSDWTKSGVALEGDSSTATGNALSDTFTTSGTSISGVTATGYTTNFTNGTTGFINVKNGTSNPLESGKSYLVEFDIIINSGVYNNNLLYIVSGGGGNIQYINADGHYSYTQYALGDDLYFRINSTSTTKNYTVSNFSVKEVSLYPSPFKDASGDVSLEAFKMVATGANAYIQLASAKTISNTTDYTNSIYIKRATGTGNILIKDINNAETVISGGEQLADNWYKYDVVSNSTSTSGQIGVKLATSGDEIYIAGANLVEASKVSSYIPIASAGSVTTRLGDVVTLTDFKDLFSDDEGVLDNYIDGDRWTYKYSDDNTYDLYFNNKYYARIGEPIPQDLLLESGETEKVISYSTLLTNAKLELTDKPTPVVTTSQGLSWNSSSDTYARLGTISAIATSTSAGNSNLPIQSEMKRCLLNDDGTVNYYLDADDSDLKADGVTASDLTGTDGQVMVEIPKFYYYETLVGTVKSWYISLTYIEGFELHPAFWKDGQEVNYRYMSAFEGGMYDASTAAMCAKASIPSDIYASGDKMTSVAGTWAKTNETRAEYRTMAAERGTGWRQLDYYLHSAIQLLYLVEYADFNSQTMIGDGRTNLSDGGWTADSYIGLTGLSIGDGNGTNSVANGSTNYLTDYMTYRGIENLYGNVWKMVDGITWDGSWTGSAAAQPVYVTNNSTYFADQVSTNMKHLCDATYIGTAAGYTSNIENVTGFIPSAVGSSSTTNICDDYYQYSEVGRDYWRVVLVGGTATHGGGAGVFSLAAGNAWSGDSTYIAGRLCF